MKRNIILSIGISGFILLGSYEHIKNKEASSLNMLGVPSAFAESVSKHDGKAVALLQKAAAKGDAKAQYNLGISYFRGSGVPQDYKKAVEWYRQAAAQGFAAAQINLGFAYASGQGVPQDNEKAAAWYQKAADQGDAAAQKRLKNLHFIPD